MNRRGLHAVAAVAPAILGCGALIGAHMTHDEALALIVRDRGTYSPGVVDAFLSAEPLFQRLWTEVEL